MSKKKNLAKNKQQREVSSSSSEEELPVSDLKENAENALGRLSKSKTTYDCGRIIRAYIDRLEDELDYRQKRFKQFKDRLKLLNTQLNKIRRVSEEIPKDTYLDNVKLPSVISLSQINTAIKLAYENIEDKLNEKLEQLEQQSKSSKEIEIETSKKLKQLKPDYDKPFVPVPTASEVDPDKIHNEEEDKQLN